MSSVSLMTVYGDFIKADTDGSSRLSKKEIARESLLLRTNGKTAEADLFAAFVAAGPDKTGLLPDYYASNGRTGTDGELSLGDIAALAAQDAGETNGSAESISTRDFTLRFGSQATNFGPYTTDQLNETAFPGIGAADDSDKLLNTLQKLLPLLNLFKSSGFNFAQTTNSTSSNPFGGSTYNRTGYSPNEFAPISPNFF